MCYLYASLQSNSLPRANFFPRTFIFLSSLFFIFFSRRQLLNTTTMALACRQSAKKSPYVLHRHFPLSFHYLLFFDISNSGFFVKWSWQTKQLKMRGRKTIEIICGMLWKIILFSVCSNEKIYNRNLFLVLQPVYFDYSITESKKKTDVRLYFRYRSTLLIKYRKIAFVQGGTSGLLYFFVL